MKIPALVLVALALASPAAAQVATLYSCPLGTGGDQVTRGFYVTNYPGYSLNDVTLNYYSGSGDGTYTISLTPRISSYAGTVVGTTQTQAVNIAGSGPVAATFSFGGAPLPHGATVTFTQVLVSGPVASPVAFYDTGTGPCTDITETEGTSPPLDTFRRDSIGVTITGSTAPLAPTAAIPTLGELALAALSATLALAGLAAMRRRDRRS